MAIVAGDFVTPHRVSAEYTRGYQAQPVRFGVCDAVDGGNRSVLWDDGRHQTGIAETALDEVLAPTATTQMGKVVELDINPTATLEPSPSFDAAVVGMYRRDLEAAGAITANYCLVKLINANVYLEVLASRVGILPPR